MQRVGRLLVFRDSFDPAAYWESRHQRNRDSLASVGHICLSEAENEADYVEKIQHVLAALVSALGNLRGKCILDAGCGIGMLTKALVDEGAEVCAVDLSGSALSAARRRAPTARFACTPLEVLSYDRAFDAVVSMDVLFHVIDDEKWRRTLSQFAAAIKAGGVILIQEMLTEVHGPRPSHVRWRTLEDYKAALVESGLSISSVESYRLSNEHVEKSILTVRAAR